VISDETYLAEFAGHLPGNDLPWLLDMRVDALARFKASGLPDRKVEAWRYTDLKAIKDQLFDVQGSPDGTVPPALLADSCRLVFDNGILLEVAMDLPPGVRLCGMTQAIAEASEFMSARIGQLAAVRDLPLPALNQAMSRDGYVLIVEPGIESMPPVEVLFLNQHGASYPRNLVLVGENSKATIVEHYLGSSDATYLTNAVTEIQVSDGGKLQRYKIQQEALAASHIATVAGELADNSEFENFDLNLGGALARSEIHLALQGQGARADLNGIYLLRGTQHCDNTINVDHVFGATNSQQDYRGILDDQAHGVFQGKITVRPDAQGISGHQLNKTLLLSEKAEINCKPELEILADDVKCSHGATSGELDESGLFYLRSRGIPEVEARRMLMAAFIAETLAHVGDESMRNLMDQLVSDWMTV